MNKSVSKVSIVGVGMITTPGVTYRMFKALAKKKINIEVISTSEIKISVLINKKNLKKLVKESQTPGGLNEQAIKDLRKAGFYRLLEKTSNRIIKRLNKSQSN